MDNKHYFIYKTLVCLTTLLLFGVKVGFLYISYIISNILHIRGFVSILFIVCVWTCFNTLVDFIIRDTIEKNKDGE